MRSTTSFVCQQCGYTSPKWIGQCPGCSAWNTLVETEVFNRAKNKEHRTKGKTSESVRLSEVRPKDYVARTSSGIGEVDRVLGGGIIPGMVTLVAGEPGIGKSTLLLQIADKISQLSVLGSQLSGNSQPVFGQSDKQKTGKPITENRKLKTDDRVIYVAGEESATQIANRAERLGIKGENIQVLEETDVDLIIDQLSVLSSQLSDNSQSVSQSAGKQTTDKQLTENRKQKTDNRSLVIVDSIQTLTTQDLTGTAGSIGQVRECAARLTAWSKRTSTPLFLVGHVTKEGSIAGPRVLEHMVDTVLWFEGERTESLRILRTIKNRFGPTDEVGIFSMEEKGLVEVANPSEMFLGEQESVPGSVATAIMEGTRALLVEIQALVVQTKLAFPKRVAQGIDQRRVELLIAVLTRRGGLPLWEYDIYVNVAGGIKIQEPGADLAVALAIASAFSDKAVAKDVVAVGEVGLLGDVRGVIQLERRMKEAKRLGYKTAISSREVKTLGEAIRKYVSSK